MNFTRALHLQERRTREQMKSYGDRNWIARQAEDHCLAQARKDRRLARMHGDLLDINFSAKIAEHGLDQIVIAH